MSKTKETPAAKPAAPVATPAPVGRRVRPRSAKAPVVADATPVVSPERAKPNRTKDVVRTIFVITDIARPVSGPRLYAHTVAALTVLGMFGKDNPAVLRSALQALVGATAIRYHVRTKGTMVEKGDKIALTPPGAAFFKTRTYNPADAAGFEALFTKGDGTAVNVRKEHIAPMSLAL